MKKLKLILITIFMACMAAFGLTACDMGGMGGNGGGGGQPTVPDYSNPPEVYNQYGDIVIDGVVDDEGWDKVNKFVSVDSVLGVTHYSEVSAAYCEEGLLMYFQVFGAKTLINESSHPFYNPGIELYIAPAGATTTNGVGWQLGLIPNNTYVVTENKVTSLDGNWEYITRNSWLDIQGTIHEVEGDLTKTGYVIEVMMPWDLFGYEPYPEWLSIDFALQYCQTMSTGRDAWFSLSNSNHDVYSLQNPTTWFKFSKYGYCDYDAPMEYYVNNGETLENGTVEVTGTVADGATVTVTPDDGYVLKSLKVNGKTVTTSTYYVPAQSTPALEIEVEFMPIGDISYTSLNANILMKKFIKYDALADGTVVTLTSVTNSYEATVTNGKIAIDTMACGLYQVLADGCDPLNINVTDEYTDDIVLDYTVFESLTGGTVVLNDANNGNLTVKNGISAAFAEDDIIYASFDLVDRCDLDGSRSGLGIYLMKDGVEGYTSAISLMYDSGTLRIRQMYSDWTTIELAKYSLGDTVKVSLAVTIIDGKVNLLYKYNGSAWINAWTLTGDYGYIKMLHAASSISEVSNLVVSDTLGDIAFATTIKNSAGQVITDGSLGTVSVVNNGFGKNSTITVTPVEGYKVKSIVINGANLTENLANGVLTYNSIDLANNIEVVFAELGNLNAILNLKYASSAVYGASTPVKEGTTVSIKGVGAFTVGANGVLTLNGFDAGSYTYTVEGCDGEYTFEVSASSFETTEYITRKVIASSSAPANSDYSDALNGNISWSNGANLFLAADGVKFVSATYTGNSDRANSSGFYIYMDPDQNGAWTEAYMLRYDSEVKPTLIKNVGWETLRLTSYYTAGTTYSVDLALAIYDGYGYMMFKVSGTDNWRIFKTFKNTYGDIHMIGAGLPNSTATNLRISETVPQEFVNILATSSTVTVKDGMGNVVTDESMGTVTVNSSAIGQPATVTVVTKADYIIGSVIVNGTDVTSQLVEGVYTFTPSAAAITVEVIFTSGQYNATLTLTYADSTVYGVGGGFVPEGSIVTIDGKSGSWTVGENGVVVIENLPAGSYTFTVDTCDGIGTFELNEDTTANVALFKKIVESVSVPANADVTKIYEGNFSTTNATNITLALPNIVFASADTIDVATATGKSGFGIYLSSGNGWSSAMCVYFEGGALKLRHMYTNWTTKVLADAYTLGSDAQVTLGVAIIDGNIYYLYKYNSNNWEIAWTVTGDYGYIKMVGSGVASRVSNLKLLTEVPSDVLAASSNVTIKNANDEVVTDGSLGTATVTNASIGKTATLTITAENGYIIDTVLVNGQNVTTQVVNGVYTFTVNSSVVDVEVKYAIGAYKATVTLTYADDSAWGKGGDYIPEGSIVTVVGKAGQYVVGANGVVVIENLPAGSYTYNVDVCANAGTIEITNADVNSSATLLRKLFTSETSATVNVSDANNGNLSWSNSGSAFFTSDKVQFVSATYTGSTALKDGTGFAFYMDRTQSGGWSEAFMLRYDSAGNIIFVKNAGWETFVPNKADFVVGDNYVVDMSMAIYDGYVYMLYKASNSSAWQLFKAVQNTFGDILMVNAGKPAIATGLKISETVPSDIISVITTTSIVTIKDGEGEVVTDGSLGTVSVNSSVIGKSATVTVDPAEGKIIGSVIVNGADVTTQLVDGVYTFVPMTNQINVEVIFTVGQYKATLALTYADDYVYGKGGLVEEGAILTVEGKAGTYTVGANGVVVVDNLPAGSYTFTLNTSSNSGTFEIVDSDITSEVALLRKVIDSSSVPANSNYSDANNGNVTWTAGANLFLANQNVKFVSAKYTGVAQSNNKDSSGFYIYMDRDQGGAWTQAYILRYDSEVKPTLVQNKPWETLRLTSYYTAGTTYSVYLAFALYDGYGYMLFKTDASANWRLFRSFENVYGDILMIGAGLPTTVTELKISETVPADIVNFVTTTSTVTVKDGNGNVVTDDSLGTVSVDSSFIGANATVEVKPNGDYLIASVLVNGENVTSQLVDGVYTFKPSTNSINVEVVFAVGQYDVTLTLKYADDSVHDVGGLIEEGAIVTVIGKTYTVGANGLVVLEDLPAGSYTFTVNTCSNVGTFEIVNGDITIERSLLRTIFTRSSAPGSADYSDANNGNLTWTSGANLYLANQDFVFVSARYKGGASSINNNSTSSGFYIYMSNDGGATNSEGLVMQYTNPSSSQTSSTGYEARLARHTNWSVKSTLTSSYSFNWILDVHLAVALYNGNVYFLFQWNNGGWRYFTHFENTFGKIHMIGCGKPANVSELTLSYEIPTDAMAIINAQ